MTIQSNVVAAVEEGTEDLEDLKEWMLENSAAYFDATRRTFEFGGDVRYPQKIR